ncbi:MAG: hypothetical protein IJJ41_02635 [Clostridia bacterium]|nr:hypothetical protein [Clostridia bacterium]
MLKGVNRQVLEVSEPDSRYFERILFVVKPEFAALSAAKLLKEAQAQVKKGGSAPPKMGKPAPEKRGLYVAIMVLGAALAGTILALVLK